MAESGSSRTLTDISVEGVQKRKLGTNKPQNVGISFFSYFKFLKIIVVLVQH